MILLDTHIWIWWVQGDKRLPHSRIQWLTEKTEAGIGISLISCWEVAKSVENRNLQLPCSTDQWFEHALSYPGIQLLELTVPIILDSTQLPPPFHRDPADQLIVATARVKGIPLLTADQKILEYPYVQTIAP